ncbi:DMT family transporter [Flavobacterium sp.]|uniref:DMT family transporter n=1 Tax=Flavobacterium sp. TaxID=239 RepID=UPI0038FC8BCE
MDLKQLKWVYLSVLALIWGSSFILIKKGLVGLTPLQLGSLRIIFAAIFLLLIGFKSLSKIPIHSWKFIALTSLFGTFIPGYLFAIAQTQIDSSISSILNSLTPLNTLLLGTLAFGIQFKRSQIYGVIIGFIGSILLILNGAFNHPNQNYFFAILIIIASMCYAINANLIKKHLSNLTPLSINTGNFFVMLIPALTILFFSGFFDVVKSSEVNQSIYFVIILGILGTGIANIIFFKIVQMSSPVFATSVTYLIPIVAFSWGFLDNEILTPIQFIGAFIILVGVYLSSKKIK